MGPTDTDLIANPPPPRWGSCAKPAFIAVERKQPCILRRARLERAAREET